MLSKSAAAKPRSFCDHDIAMLQIEVKGKVVTAQPQRKFYFAVNKPKVGAKQLGNLCPDRRVALGLMW